MLALIILLGAIIIAIMALVYYGCFAPDGLGNLSGVRDVQKNQEVFNNPIIDAFLQSVPKEEPKYEVITIGDPNHKHKHLEADWDKERFGSDLTNMDDDPGGMAFPCGTYKDLWRCVCGREVIRSERALINMRK